jgi:hypothetical protein
MSKLKVTKIPNLNTIVIRQEEDRDFFITSSDSIVISVSSLMFILHFLVMNGYISQKTLEGILEEYYTDKGRER